MGFAGLALFAQSWALRSRSYRAPRAGAAQRAAFVCLPELDAALAPDARAGPRPGRARFRGPGRPR